MEDSLSVVSALASRDGGVAVLCGGPGGEREVSLESGANVHRALLRAGVDNRLVIIPARDPEEFLSGLDCSLAVMMLHGEFGEDGTAQAILEARGIPFTGSDSRSCRLSMDKNAVKVRLRELGVPTPRWILAGSADEAARKVAEAGLAYPLFVKPNAGGSSVATSRVDASVGLAGSVELTLMHSSPALVEEMVVGRELTVGWLDGRTLPIIEMEADGAFYDYHAKYQSEDTRYRCPAELEAGLAESIHQYVGLVAETVGARDLARVDLMLGPAGPMILELNALPGFTAHSLLPMAARVAGIELEALCLSLAVMAAGRVEETGE